MPTLVLQPAEAAMLDTAIHAGSPAENYGTDGGLYIGDQGGAWRSLIKFDLASLPAGVIITSAVLALTMYQEISANARTARVYRVKRAWVEGDGLEGSGATWNTYDGVNSWQAAGGFGADDCEQTEIGSRALSATEPPGVKEITLTAGSKEALDLGHGWLIKVDGEASDYYAFWSSNGTPSNRPKLTLIYETVTAGDAQTYQVPATPRTYQPDATPRTFQPPATPRTYRVSATPRTYQVPVTRRTHRVS